MGVDHITLNHESGFFTPSNFPEPSKSPQEWFWMAVCYNNGGFVFFSFFYFNRIFDKS
jgi:hypothetical protein